MCGVYIVAFGLLAIAIAANGFRRGERWPWALVVGNTIAFAAAMPYDRIVAAIGPFELSEYLGLAGIYATLAITAPFAQPCELTGHRTRVSMSSATVSEGARSLEPGIVPCRRVG